MNNELETITNITTLESTLNTNHINPIYDNTNGDDYNNEINYDNIRNNNMMYDY